MAHEAPQDAWCCLMRRAEWATTRRRAHTASKEAREARGARGAVMREAVRASREADGDNRIEGAQIHEVPRRRLGRRVWREEVGEEARHHVHAHGVAHQFVPARTSL
jgi:hypothetical protein